MWLARDHSRASESSKKLCLAKQVFLQHRRQTLDADMFLRCLQRMQEQEVIGAGTRVTLNLSSCGAGITTYESVSYELVGNAYILASCTGRHLMRPGQVQPDCSRSTISELINA